MSHNARNCGQVMFVNQAGAWYDVRFIGLRMFVPSPGERMRREPCDFQDSFNSQFCFNRDTSIRPHFV